MSRYSEILHRFLPAGAVKPVLAWLDQHPVVLRISKKRFSRLGDYKPPQNGVDYHRISVNYDLNPYHFLLTLVHEMAHYHVWKAYKNRVKPHGREWQEEYYRLMKPFLNESIFPQEILPSVTEFVKKPGSSAARRRLEEAIRKLNGDVSHEPTVEDISENGLFRLQNGRIYRKGPKNRTRYKCLCVNNGRYYLVNGTFPAVPVTINEER
ncbi:MAG: SprT-like domain-containing protein [Bacteroidales bacterium]